LAAPDFPGDSILLLDPVSVLRAKELAVGQHSWFAERQVSGHQQAIVASFMERIARMARQAFIISQPCS
jgi:hypothetical protein